MKAVETVSRLWSARSVAVVGASESKGKPGYRVLANLRKFGYAGEIYPVNSRLETCQGLPCYPSLSSLPEVPETVAIVLSAKQVPAVMLEAAERGTRCVLIISSGFGEAGDEGASLQNEVAGIADTNDMAVCGPNSVGFIRTSNNLALTFTEALAKGALAQGRLGFVSQSGAFGTVLYAQARERGLGFNTYVSSGNEVSLNFGDYARALLEDDGIDVVGGYVEGLRDSNSLWSAAQRSKELNKPLVVLKVGRSQRGGSAAASHTGAMVGSDAAYQAAFDKLGILQVEDEQQLLDGLDALQTHPHVPESGRVAIVSMSGGAGVLITDLLEEKGLTLAEVSPSLELRLRELLPPFASVNNPIDVTGQFVTNPVGIDDVIEAVAGDPGVDLVVVYIGLAWSRSEVWQAALEKAAKVGKPILVGAPMVEPGSDLASTLRSSGVTVYRGARQIVDAVDLLVRWARHRAQPWVPVRPSNSQSVTEPQLAGEASEADMKALLAARGFRVPRGRVVAIETEAIAFARELGGPAVLKAQGPGLSHKSDIGGVILDIAPNDVPAAFTELKARLEEHGVAWTGAYMEEMVPDGLELMVGAVHSPPFGCLMALSEGGVDVELNPSINYAVPPLSREEAKRLVDRLPVAPKLFGYRGDEGYDTEGLYDFLVGISKFIAENKDVLLEMDLNPIKVMRQRQGICVLDAMAVFREAQE